MMKLDQLIMGLIFYFVIFSKGLKLLRHGKYCKWFIRKHLTENSIVPISSTVVNQPEFQVSSAILRKKERKKEERNSLPYSLPTLSSAPHSNKHLEHGLIVSCPFIFVINTYWAGILFLFMIFGEDRRCFLLSLINVNWFGGNHWRNNISNQGKSSCLFQNITKWWVSLLKRMSNLLFSSLKIEIS